MGNQQDAGAGRVVVNLSPEIDIADAGQVSDLLTAMLGRGVRVVIADLSGTRFCDSGASGICCWRRGRLPPTAPSCAWLPRVRRCGRSWS